MERNIANLSISLPKGMKERIKRRVEEDDFGTPSDYLRSLVREDLRQHEEKRLEHALLAGLRSGRGSEILSKADWKKFWDTIDVQRGKGRIRKYA